MIAQSSFSTCFVVARKGRAGLRAADTSVERRASSGERGDGMRGMTAAGAPTGRLIRSRAGTLLQLLLPAWASVGDAAREASREVKEEEGDAGDEVGMDMMVVMGGGRRREGACTKYSGGMDGDRGPKNDNQKAGSPRRPVAANGHRRGRPGGRQRPPGLLGSELIRSRRLIRGPSFVKIPASMWAVGRYERRVAAAAPDLVRLADEDADDTLGGLAHSRARASVSRLLCCVRTRTKYCTLYATTRSSDKEPHREQGPYQHPWIAWSHGQVRSNPLRGQRPDPTRVPPASDGQGPGQGIVGAIRRRQNTATDYYYPVRRVHASSAQASRRRLREVPGKASRYEIGRAPRSITSTSSTPTSWRMQVIDCTSSNRAAPGSMERQHRHGGGERSHPFMHR